MTYEKKFNSDATEVAFLLGGIGTGNISITAGGELVDWEIFNHPSKKLKMYQSFFSIYAKKEDDKPVAKILEAKLNPPYSHPFGGLSGCGQGLPHMDKSTLKAEYPFAMIEFQDEDLPVDVSLEAFTPFIPLDADNSGIPCIIFRYKVKNNTDKATDVTIASSLVNMCEPIDVDLYGNNYPKIGETKNEYVDKGKYRGLEFSAENAPKDSRFYREVSVMTRDTNVTVKSNWLKNGRWFDPMQNFWDEFSKDGVFQDNVSYSAEQSLIGPHSSKKIGSLGICHKLAPNEEKEFEFVLSWYVPNRIRGWDDQNCHMDSSRDFKTVKNYYATMFSGATFVCDYVFEKLDYLESNSRNFQRALFKSTLPECAIDAISSNITVLRSPTCFRIEDGNFFGWEGCGDNGGSCSGTCTHVWNYAQTVAFLFPQLERAMRTIEFDIETDESGKMDFRNKQILDGYKANFEPATDGQMGAIVRLYREWKLSGDDEFLKKLWPKVKKALEFAFSYWDSDNDFVLDSKQHNTYDIEFYGPNSLTNSMFYAALKACVEMAGYLGDTESHDKYKNAYEQGSKKMDEILWNGEYYIQEIDDINKYLYQYGEGCLSDQVLGQFLAHMAGLGYVLPEEHIKSAVYSIYKYNYKTSMKNHANVQRTYAFNDERGLLLCSWPKDGTRPVYPFVYSDEVWTGIEYQVASHLICEGFVEEGLDIVKAVRDRYNGYNRNPFNEVECGHHYARSMASWGILIGLSGFKADMVNKTISFDPKINKENFSTFFSTGSAWGIYTQTIANGKVSSNVEVLYGNLDGVKIN